MQGDGPRPARDAYGWSPRSRKSERRRGQGGREGEPKVTRRTRRRRTRASLDLVPVEESFAKRRPEIASAGPGDAMRQDRAWRLTFPTRSSRSATSSAALRPIVIKELDQDRVRRSGLVVRRTHEPRRNRGSCSPSAGLDWWAAGSRCRSRPVTTSLPGQRRGLGRIDRSAAGLPRDAMLGVLVSASMNDRESARRRGR